MHAAGAERALAALAATQHGAFGRRQAASVGMSAKTIARAFGPGCFRNRSRGGRVHGGAGYMATTAHDRRRSARRHRRVARRGGGLHRLDGFDAGPLDGDRPARIVTTRFLACVVHRAALDRCDLTRVDGIPCTNIARTLCDLGAVVSQDRVEQALDDALRRGVSERWIRETLSRVDRPGPSGTGDVATQSSTFLTVGRLARQLVRAAGRAPPRALGASSTRTSAQGVRDRRHSSRVPRSRVARGGPRRRALRAREVMPAPATSVAITRVTCWLASEDWEVLYAPGPTSKIPSASADPSRRWISAACERGLWRTAPMGHRDATVGSAVGAGRASVAHGHPIGHRDAAVGSARGRYAAPR